MQKTKIYQGKRDDDRKMIVTVDGHPLYCVHYHSDGFEVGYSGSGCAELSLAILRNYFGENYVTRPYILKMKLGQKMPKSLALYQDFKRAFITPIQGNEWTITSKQIAEWVEKQPKEEGE